MASSISVPYTILSADDAIAESWDPQNGPTATIKFRCLWDDRYQLVRDLVGTYTGTPPSTITRVPPFAYPASPNLFCTAIQSIEPHGKPTLWSGIGWPWITRKNAIVTAMFGVPRWDFSGPDSYTKISFDCSAEVLSLPETSCVFADGTPAMTQVGFLVPQMQITVERNRMPFLPVAAMAQCEGKVNSAPYQILGFPFAPGFLLFMAGKSDYQLDATGQIAYSQEYIFMARNIPHNWLMKPNGSGFAPITDRAGNPPYGSVDFSFLP